MLAPMNWEAIGSVGEAVGAAAVVISVGYLAMQVRKQTAEQRLVATRDLSAQINEALAPVVEDPEMTRLYRAAIRDFDGLRDEDRLRVSLFLSRMMSAFEQQYLHASQGHVDPTYVESAYSRFKEGFTFPGIRRWWELNREAFSPEFRAHADRAAAEASRAGYKSSFGTDA